MEKNTKAKSQRKQNLEKQRKQSLEQKSFTSYCEVNQLAVPHDLKEFARLYSDYCKRQKI